MDIPRTNPARRPRRHRALARFFPHLATAWALLALACGSSGSALSGATDTDGDGDATPPSAVVADVIEVSVSGISGQYRFSVTVASPDSGCSQYADWWEVVTDDGELVDRRILLHSHVTEQPFTRSGSTVAIEAEQTVWVRAHMHPDGYGGQALHGSVSAGFEPRSPVSGFAADLATQPPLPDDCDL